MEKMRNSTGVVLWILILSFGILWMLQGTGVFSSFGGGPRSLGSVNGTPIQNQDYQRLIQSYSNRYSRSTGNSPNAEQRAYFRQQAWNNIVTGKLLSQKMDQLGITVTDQEVVNMIEGAHPDPFIRKQFSKKDGSIDRVALNQAIESKKNSRVWVAIEQQLRQKRRQQKMTNFVQSAMQVSDQEARNQYIKNHTTADVHFLRFPYADVPRSEISITDDDLRSYYKEHSSKFHQKETYRFKYVTFNKTPTKQDTARTLKELKDVREDFAQTSDDSLFLNRYQSTTSYRTSYIAKGDVKKLFKQSLDTLKEGEVSPVIQANGNVYLLKKQDDKSDSLKFLILSHHIKADPIATVDKRAEDADDFSYFAAKNGFSKEATRRHLPLKEGFATKGNNFISGLGQSRQIMEVLKNTDERHISKTIELPNEFVVLEVTDITPKGTRPLEKVKSQIRNTVLAQKREKKVAERVTNLLKSNRDLNALAKTSGKNIQTVKALKMNDETIAGAGREPRVIGAIFGLDQNEISKPIKGTSAVFVAKVTDKTQADPQKMTASQTQKIKKKLLQKKSQVFAQAWLKELKDRADIVDNRAKIFKNRR